jgi:hypothetical protein
LCFPSAIVNERVITVDSLWFFMVLSGAAGLCVGG